MTRCVRVERRPRRNTDRLRSPIPAMSRTVRWLKRAAVVPHADVIPQSDLVITPAGHGTAIRALAAGTPLVCIPFGRDQFDVTARVVWHGAGLKASAKATEAALKEAIARVLEDPSFRHSAQTLAKAISQETEQDLAVGELESLASGRRPRQDSNLRRTV